MSKEARRALADSLGTEYAARRVALQADLAAFLGPAVTRLARFGHEIRELDDIGYQAHVLSAPSPVMDQKPPRSCVEEREAIYGSVKDLYDVWYRLEYAIAARAILGEHAHPERTQHEEISARAEAALVAAGFDRTARW